MGWSVQVGRLAGIPINIHISFALILLFGAVQWGIPYRGIGALYGMGLMVAIFVCVALHELGHALAARMFGLKTRAIILFPLGGAAILERQPSRPFHELVIAVAGPLVNLALSIVLGIATAALLVAQSVDPRSLTPDLLRPPSLLNGLIWLLTANIALVLFNLIPAYPLDGGRILRSILAMATNQTTATRVATSIGQLLAIALGLYGILSFNLILLMVAVFIYLGASQEKVESRAGTILSTISAADSYNKHALVLAHGDRIGTVVDYMQTSYQSDFAVMHNDQLIGIVTREDVLRAIETAPAEAYVSGIMRRNIVTISATLSLEETRQHMMQAGQRVAAVYQDAQYLGLISIEDIAEVYSLRTVIERRRQPTV